MLKAITPVVPARKQPRVIGYLADNFVSVEHAAEPALILNPAASRNAVLAWCAAEAQALHDMAVMMTAADATFDAMTLRQVGEAVMHRTGPLNEVMYHLTLSDSDAQLLAMSHDGK